MPNKLRAGIQASGIANLSRIVGTGAAALLLTLQACTPDQKGNTIFGSLQAAGHIRMASQAFQPSIERADHTFVDTTSLLPSDDAIISDSDFPEIFDGNYGVENTSATKQLSSQQPVVKGRSPTSSQATVYPANKELYKKPVHTETAAEDTHDHASAETTHREPVAVTLGDGADLSQEDSHHVAEDTDNNHHNHREPSNREDFLPDGHHTSAGDHSSRLGHDGAQNNHDQHANKDNATHKHDSDPHQQNTLGNHGTHQPSSEEDYQHHSSDFHNEEMGFISNNGIGATARLRNDGGMVSLHAGKNSFVHFGKEKGPSLSAGLGIHGEMDRHGEVESALSGNIGLRDPYTLLGSKGEWQVGFTPEVFREDGHWHLDPAYFIANRNTFGQGKHPATFAQNIILTKEYIQQAVAGGVELSPDRYMGAGVALKYSLPQSKEGKHGHASENKHFPSLNGTANVGVSHTLGASDNITIGVNGSISEHGELGGGFKIDVHLPHNHKDDHDHVKNPLNLN